MVATSQDVQNAFLEFELPEELVARGNEWVGRVIAAGGQLPPERLAAKSGNRGIHLHIAIEPLSLRYQSDRSQGFEDDNEHVWLAMYDKNNKPQQPDSNLDKVKKGFLKLGYPIRNNADCQALVGKIFTFENTRIKREFKKKDAAGNDTVEENTSWLQIPTREEAPTWVPTAPIETIKRPREAAATPSAASVGDNENVALPKLAAMLNGKTELEYFNTIMTSKDPDCARAPYIVEASQSPADLTRRLMAIPGVRQEAGVLVVG